MKNKILKSSKSAISILIAFAVVLVSLFVAVPTINIDADAAALTATDTWDGTKTQPTSTDADGNIIINTAEELAWVALEGGTATNGKSYKVAANQVFNLNGFTGVTPDSTLAEVKAATATGKLWRGSAENIYFGGNFDGNGLVVYNANSYLDEYTGQADEKGHGGAGLFPFAQPYQSGAIQSFKNVKVAASAFKAYHGAGGIVGYANPNTTDRKWIFESIAVDSVYIYTHSHNQKAGGIAGIAGHTGVTINNCMVSDIDVVGKTKSALVASTSNFSPSHSFSNSIVLGYTPISNETGTKLASATYSGVYTDANVTKAGIIPNDTSEMKEKSCSKLDFSAYWLANSGVPELRVFHKLSATNNGDGTHAEKCTRCGLTGLPAEHNFAIFVDEKTDGCACGATQKAPHRATDVWDGTKVEPKTTDADGNIIINNAEELAWVALDGGAATNGKNYKVADNQIFDLDGFNDINLNSTLADIKSATATGKLWRGSSDGIYFGGNFDGNGLVVYNANSYNDGNTVGGHGGAGLFPYAQPYKAGEKQTFKNVSVQVSAFKAYHAAGGIVGYANPDTTDRKWAFSQCSVENVYFYTHTHQQKAGGLVGIAGHTGVTINNCLVADVELVGKIVGGFIASTSAYSADHIIKNSIAVGVSPVSNETGSKLSDATYTDVYSDIETSKTTKPETMIGAAGKNSMGGLDYDYVWLANTTKAPVLKIFHRLTGTANGAKGHSEKCEPCGLVGLTDEAPHVWKTGECSVCSYNCKHPDVADGEVVDEGSCTTDKVIAQDCECGAAPNKVIEAKGHDLEKTSDGFEGNCGVDGQKPYWTCKKCGGIFLSDDKWGTPVDISDTIIPATGAHTVLKDSETGETVWDMTKGGYHRNICAICSKPYNPQAHEGDGFIPDPANPEKGHIGTCEICLLKSDDGVTPHAFGDDNVCDTCNYVCNDHQYQSVEEATVTQAGDCVTDEYRDISCKICGHTKKNQLTKVADGHTFELIAEDGAKCKEDGVAAHNYCSKCGLNYAVDADATSVPLSSALSDEDLKIPSLNQEHQYLNKGAFEKEDKADGLHWRNCSICGKVDVANHTLVEDKITYEGTCNMCECGYYEFAHYNTSDDGIVSISADVGVFPLEVWTEFFDICDEDEIYTKIEEVLLKAKIISAGSELNDYSYLIYDIKPDEPMAENSTATIKFDLSKLPEDFSDNILNIDTAGKYIKIVRIDLENQMVKNDIVTTFEESAEGKITSASADVDHFSIYAVIDTQKSGSAGSSEDEDYSDFNNEFYLSNSDTSSTSPKTSARNQMATAATMVLAASVLFVLVLKFKKA